MDRYELMSGEELGLGGLSQEERTFLRRLSGDAREGADYFELLRRVKGKGALPLRGGPITPAVAASVLYRVGHDVVDRVGVQQGYLLAPDVPRPATSVGDDLLSLTEAAHLIGISRPAAHQALVERRLPGTRVGNAWVVTRADAAAFRESRERSSGPAERRAASR